MNHSEIIETARSVIQSETEQLRRIGERLGEGFAQAVELIDQSNRVIVTGIGKSGLVAQKIAATLTSLGIESHFLHPIEAMHGDIGIVKPDDTVIILSKSGTTEELIRLMPYLKSRKAKIIAIVGNEKSYMSRAADIFIDATVDCEADPFNYVPTTSALAALAISDALAVCLMKRRQMTVEDFSRNHPHGQIGRNLTVQVRDIMHKNSYLPKIFPNSLFRDAVIETSDKGLGCVCVVDKDDMLRGIITDGDIRRILQRYEDIRGLVVESVMTKSPIVVSPETYLGEALSIMENRESEINVLPVVDTDGRCLGVIRIHDILHTGA